MSLKIKNLTRESEALKLVGGGENRTRFVLCVKEIKLE